MQLLVAAYHTCCGCAWMDCPTPTLPLAASSGLPAGAPAQPLSHLQPRVHPPQMRKVQEKIEELQAAHSAQIEAVVAQYGALLQQVRGLLGAGLCAYWMSALCA